MELTQLPKKLIIIGGGVIGCEFASLYRELDVEVVILEALPQIIAIEGKGISDALTASLKKRGIEIRTGVAVAGMEKDASSVTVVLQSGEKIVGDHLLVAIGRKYNSESLGLEKAGVYVDKRGCIEVNERMETSTSGIYAIGDVTGKVLLAHVASHQGVVAAENAIGLSSVMHYNAVPSVIFTHPEIGTVGMTLEKALEAGRDAAIGKFPFQALGKSQAVLETEGFAQVVVDRANGQILGAQVMGYEASSLVAEMALAIQNELTIECITETIHAHPTIAEAWLEASWIARGIPIHLPPKVRR
jgi:dihydrolipoamide dehydrogenase